MIDIEAFRETRRFYAAATEGEAAIAATGSPELLEHWENATGFHVYKGGFYIVELRPGEFVLPLYGEEHASTNRDGLAVKLYHFAMTEAPEMLDLLTGPRKERTQEGARAGVPLSAANVRFILAEMESQVGNAGRRKRFAAFCADNSGNMTEEARAVYRAYAAGGVLS